MYDFAGDMAQGNMSAELLDGHDVASSFYDLTATQPQRSVEDVAALVHNFQKDSDILCWATSVLAESPTAGALLNSAYEKGWSFGFTDLSGGGYFLNNDAKILMLDHFCMAPNALGRSLYFRNALLTTFIRALRDIAQQEAFGSFEQDFGPEQVLMLERARAADCDTVVILAGWELRGAGFTDVWRHILGSEEGDMALIFSRFLERDPASLFDGTALAYAFRQWYADRSRVDHADHMTLETLDDMLQNAEQRNPFGQTELKGALIESLALLPDGVCYLAGLGDAIISDPFFAGLNDEINQTHLFHLIYDMEVTMINNVPFRDNKLARMIFPEATPSKSWR